MKIIHIIEASATGTLSMAALLANAQKATGHDVEIIYSKRLESPNDLKKYFNEGITLTQIQMRTATEKITSLRKLRTALLESSPHVVFMHSSFAGFLGRLASLCILKNSTFLYVPHCISFMRKDVGHFKRVLFTTFEWLAAAKHAEYVACSKSEQLEIQKRIPFRTCHLVENAVKTSASPTTREILPLSVITVGQIRPQKGPLDFAKIASQVIQQMPEVSFIWIGDGDPKMRAELEESGVTVTGWLEKDEVLNSLSKGGLYLSTAKWEGMPVSLIEASYSGLPIVASRCAGNVDVISHGQTGWLFDSTQQAKDLILAAFRNPHAASLLARKAYREAKHRFSVDRYTLEMESLLFRKNRSS